MPNLRFLLETLLYASVAILSDAIAWSGEMDWRFVCKLALAGLLVIKAKLSPSRTGSSLYAKTASHIRPQVADARGGSPAPDADRPANP